MYKALSTLWFFLLFSSANFINAQCTASQYEAVININTIGTGYDVYWYLVGPMADTIARGGESGTYGSNSSFTDSVCLDYGINYTFYAYDATGNGWEGGTYEVLNNGQVIINNNGFSPDNGSSTTFNDLESSENFIVNQPINIDVALLDITQPGTGCDLDSNEIVKVALVNNGLLGLDSIVLTFSDNNNPLVSETFYYITALAPGSFDTVAFSSTADFSAIGNHNLQVDVNMPADSNTSNNSLAINFTNTASTSGPNALNFDNSIVGTTGIIDSVWSVSSTTDFEWLVETGSTLSTSTGPSGDASGNGNYLYTEASYPADDGDETVLESNCISFTGISSPALEFKYHKYGTDMGDLIIEALENGSWITKDAIYGQTHFSESDAWLSKIVPLNSLGNQKTKIRFKAICGPGYTSDMAIDDISFFAQVSNDMAASKVLYPNSGCALSSAEQVGVQLKSMGSAPVDSALVSFQVDSGTIISELVVFSPALNFGKTYDYTFNNTADLSIAGKTYDITISVDLLGDSNSLNNSVTKSVENIIISVPYFNNFDHVASGTTGVFDVDWQGTPDGSSFRWQANNGSTLSSSTGPIGDHTTGMGTYLYTEASSSGDTAILQSNCFDLSGASTPMLSFYYHMYGADMGNLYIDVLHNGTWYTEDSIIGQQQNSDTEDWKEKIVSLSAYAGDVVTVRFLALRGPNYMGDICIDDIGIINIPSNELALNEVYTPEYICGLSASEVIKGKVQNRGINPLSSFVATYSLFGSVVSDTISVNPPIGFGEFYTFSFTTTVDLSTPGLTYNLDVHVNLQGDSINSNDSINGILIEHASPVITPYAESFDNMASGQSGILDNIWTGSPSTGFGYMWETANSSFSSSTGPSGDHLTGNGIYLVTDNSHSAGEEAKLTSTCFSVDGMSSPALRFWYHMFGADIGRLNIEIYNNGSWDLVDSIVGQVQTSKTDPWLDRVIDLQPYASKDFAIRFTGIGTDGWNDDMALDDIEIFNLPSDEAELIEVFGPVSKCLYDYGNDTVLVRIKNNGFADIGLLDVSYSFNNGPLVTESISLNPALSATKDTVVALATIINVTNVGLQNIKAYITLLNDIDNTNDTAYHGFESFDGNSLSISTNNNLSIPDGDPIGLMVPFTFCDLPELYDSCFYIDKITIDSLSHDWLSDLDIYLISPENDTVELSTDNGGLGDDMINVSFAQNTGNDITLQTSGIIPGIYDPEESGGFSKFIGSNPNGLWHLFIVDDGSGDAGILHKATMSFKNDNPVISLGNDTTLCSWAVIELNDGGSGPNNSYLWQDGSTDPSYIVNAMNLDSTQTHSFSVNVTNDSTGCTSFDEIIINIDNCASIEEFTFMGIRFDLFPNPAKGNFSISTSKNINNNCTIKAYNTQGQLISQKSLDLWNAGQNINFNSENWSEGLYYIQLSVGEHLKTLRLSISK